MNVTKYKTINGSIIIASGETPVFVVPQSRVVLGSPANNHWRIYPNPGKNFITIDSLYDNSLISLINSSGQIIKSERSSNFRYTMALPNLVAGMYFIKIDDIYGTHSLPFIKTNR